MGAAVLAIAILAAAGLGLYLAGVSRRRAEERLAQLKLEAAPSLVELRQWRDTVQGGLAAAKASGRWISRDTRVDWTQAAPEPALAVVQLAKVDGPGDEARELLAYRARDLTSVVSHVNGELRLSELEKRRPFFDSIERQPLTEEQAAAVITFDNRVQVVAAAGSGKTSVMVARAAYAILRDFVPADRILLLAFNKDAAVELQERVDSRLAAAGIRSDGLRAATFHSFGLSIIGRATGKKPRLASWLDGGGDLAMVSRIVDDLRDHSPDFRYKWDLYRLLFARMSDDPAVGEPDSYDKASRQTGFRTYRGETVKSQGERMLADFLFLNSVNYQYEAPYEHDTADAEHSQYRPDFFYPDVDVWHEHWGLDRFGHPPVEWTGYVESMAWKRSLHQQCGTTLIETTWAGLLEDDGLAKFADDLSDVGLTLDWNPDRSIPGAAPVKHEDLAKVMRSFMAHVKSNSWTPDELDRRLAASPTLPRYRARVFLDLFWAIYVEWQTHLERDGSIDFEDMLVLSAQHLEAGNADMGYDLVLVDEFQDASRARARMCRALVAHPHRYLLAVGDDWQSINRFAGADLAVMTAFEPWFGEAQILKLQTTFRSTQAICDTSSAFIAKNPRQLAKNVTSVHPGPGSPVELLRVRSADDVAAAIGAILEYLAAGVQAGDVTSGRGGPVTVDVLGRYRFDRSCMPATTPRELKVAFRTVHASKGLEADFIILPNVTSGTYGFPSEIVDDPVLSLAMTEADPYPYAEERRLFYVALTRARQGVTVVSVAGKESAFLAELIRDGRVVDSRHTQVGPAQLCPACGKGVLVRRMNQASGRQFLACGAFPRCTHTQPMASTGL